MATTCSACHVSLEQHVNVRENSCTPCNKVFCDSCYSLRGKLAVTSRRASRKTCKVCDQLISIKKSTSSDDIRPPTSSPPSSQVPVPPERNDVPSTPPYDPPSSWQPTSGDSGRYFGGALAIGTLTMGGYWDVPFGEEEADLDQLADVPAYDDIPQAMILCGAYDKEMLARAKKKQEQIDALKKFENRPAVENVISRSQLTEESNHCPSDKEETPKVEPDIKEKRLAKLTQQQTSTQKTNRKIDTRDVAPNARGPLKPVRSTAFKNRPTGNTIDVRPPSPKPAESDKMTKSEANESGDQKRSPRPEPDDEHIPYAMLFLESNKAGTFFSRPKSEDGFGDDLFYRSDAARGTSSSQTSTKSRLDNNDYNENSSVRNVQHLQSATPTQGKKAAVTEVSVPHTEGAYVERNEGVNQAMTSTATIKQSPGVFQQLVQAHVPDYLKTPPTSQTPSRKATVRKVNKNQNMSSASQDYKGERSSNVEDARSEGRESLSTRDVQKPRPSIDREVSQKVPAAEDDIVHQMHSGFIQLKLAQAGTGVKCTVCGRPECTGQSVSQMKELLSLARKEGLEVRDVAHDGNCMFAAIVDQLQMYGDERFTAGSLRTAAVEYLINNPTCEDGFTHYEMFMSEPWQTYVQRMMSQGEWGDHVILKAIVNVVGYPARVLNANGVDTSTVINPNGCHDPAGGVELKLGHVGEFHYTSLRPADADHSMATNSVTSESVPLSDEVVPPISAEDVGVVAMFKDDYVDPWSDMPVAHLSFIFRIIAPPAYVINGTCIFSSQISAIERDSADKGIQGIVGGTAMHGVAYPLFPYGKLPGEHAREWLGLEAITIITDVGISNASFPKNSLIPADTGRHAGYTTLITGAGALFPPFSLRSNSDLKELYIRGHYVSYPNRYGFLLEPWPEVAESWQTRTRLENWPNSDLVDSIVNEGCLVTPEAHPYSKDPESEWKYLFTLAEKRIFHDAVTLKQKYCYILFRAMCFEVLANIDFKTDHMKNVFLFACEKIPAEYWGTAPASCVLYMIDSLKRAFSERCLNDYFVDSNNTLDHVSEEHCQKIEAQLHELRTQPANYMKTMGDRLSYETSDTILDQIWTDALCFKSNPFLKRSTLTTFVPCLLQCARRQIIKCQYATALETMNEAFQMHLSVSTCDDQLTYHTFLMDAVSNLPTLHTVWFSNYVDNQLGKQLARPLVQEMCGDLSLVRIDTVLPEDIAGSYGCAFVPAAGSQFDLLCHNLATFLFFIDKISEALPVLCYCRDQYKAVVVDQQQQNSGRSGFSDHGMFCVYLALNSIYRRQRQLDMVRSLLPELKDLVDRVQNADMQHVLGQMYVDYKDEQTGQAYLSHARSRLTSMHTQYLYKYQYWPDAYIGDV